MKYQRVVIKLSGQAMAGADGFGFSAQALQHLASQILQMRELGVQVAVVVGGGNVFRGNRSDSWGIDRVEADNIGMLGTVINGLLLRGKLSALGEDNVRVMTAIPINAVAEPFLRLRAKRHLDKGAILIFSGGNGQPFITTDYPSVQRALEIGADALLVAKHGVDGVYDADPGKNPDARRYERLPYNDVVMKGPDRVHPGPRPRHPAARVRHREGRPDGRHLPWRASRHGDQRRCHRGGVRALTSGV